MPTRRRRARGYGRIGWACGEGTAGVVERAVCLRSSPSDRAGRTSSRLRSDRRPLSRPRGRVHRSRLRDLQGNRLVLVTRRCGSGGRNRRPEVGGIRCERIKSQILDNAEAVAGRTSNRRTPGMSSVRSSYQGGTEMGTGGDGPRESPVWRVQCKATRLSFCNSLQAIEPDTE